MTDETPQPDESDIINMLWDARHKGSKRMTRKAIQAARSALTDDGRRLLSDEQIAAELETTPEKLEELARDPEPSG